MCNFQANIGEKEKIFNFLKYTFIYFNWRLITLQYLIPWLQSPSAVILEPKKHKA